MHLNQKKTIPISTTKDTNVTQINMTQGNFLQKKKKIVEQQRTRECRICLQNRVQSKQALITPCKCSGTVKYIHLTCLETWIQRTAAREHEQELVLGTNRIKCQLCNTAIKYQIQEVKKCNKYDQIVQQYKSKKLIALITIIISLLIFFSICILIWSIISFQFPQLSSSTIKIIFLSISIFFIVFLSIIDVLIITFQFLVSTKYVAYYVPNKNNNQAIRESQTNIINHQI